MTARQAKMKICLMEVLLGADYADYTD